MLRIITFVLCVLLSTDLHAQLSEEWRTNGAPTHPFSIVRGVLRVNPDSVWVIDQHGPYHVHILDAHTGEVVGYRARQGEGPGEMTCAQYGSRTPEGGVAIGCGVVLLEWSRDGNFSHRTNLQNFPWNTKGFFVSDDHYLVSGGFMDLRDRTKISEGSITLFSRESGLVEGQRGQSVKGVTSGYVASLISGGPIAYFDEGSFVSADGQPFRLEQHFFDSRRSRTFFLDEDRIPLIGDKFRYYSRTEGGHAVYSFRWAYPRPSFISRYKDGVLLVINLDSRDELVEEDATIFEHYDLSGNLRWSYSHPEKLWVYDLEGSAIYGAVENKVEHEFEVVKFILRPDTL